jgi:hypothetical protein
MTTEPKRLQAVLDSPPEPKTKTDAPPDEANEQAFNPFAPDNLRIDLNLAEGIGVKKAIITVPVRKPNGQDFVRVHPEPEFRLPVAIIELRDDRETFLVLPEIARYIPGEYILVTMYTAITRQGVVFFWPVRLPGSDGRQLEWHRSAAVAAEMAMTRWVRVKANMQLGAYEVYEASSTIPNPEWPDNLTFEQLLQIAFKGRLVDSLAHPVLKRLRGET